MFVNSFIEFDGFSLNSSSDERLNLRSFVDKQIVNRGVTITTLPQGVVACIADLANGLLSLPAAIFTGFCHESLRLRTIFHISGFGMLPALIADHVIRFLNPQEKIIAYPLGKENRELFFIKKLDDYHRLTENLLKDESWVNRNIIAKLSVLPMVVIATAMTVAHFVLGLLSTVAAIVTLGRIREVNEYAVDHLTVLVDFFFTMGLCTTNLLKFPA